MSKKTKGFTLIELIVVIALVGVVSTIIFTSFNALNQRQALDKEVDYIKTLIQKTRLASLNSKNGAMFRVEFASNQLTVAESGTTTVTVYPYSSNISLTTNGLTAVTGGAATTTIFFSKISGLAGARGVLTYSLMSGGSATITRTITINALGTVE